MFLSRRRPRRRRSTDAFRRRLVAIRMGHKDDLTENHIFHYFWSASGQSDRNTIRLSANGRRNFHIRSCNDVSDDDFRQSRCVWIGESQPIKEVCDRVMFRTDDTNLLFNDREAFALKPRSEQDPSIHATYSGVELIFSVDTSIGRVSARRATPIKEGIDVSEGISISSKVNVEMAFDNEVTYYDAIHRADVVISFLALMIGRPQNLVE